MVQLFTELHLRATQVNTPTLPPAKQHRYSIYLEGQKAELIRHCKLSYYYLWLLSSTRVTGYIPRQFTRPQTVIHLSTNPAAHGRELNLQPVDHKSDAITTTVPSSYSATNLTQLCSLQLLLLISVSLAIFCHRYSRLGRVGDSECSLSAGGHERLRT